MPLGDDAAFHEWRATTSDRHAIEVVGEWIKRAADEPWLSPSIPQPDVSDSPSSEIRMAVVPESGGIEVCYKQDYVSGWVDLISVRSAPPE